MALAPSPVDVVVAALAPYLGGNMARAAVNGHQLKLGLSPNLEGRDLDRLLDALTPGLGVFVGRDKTREVADEIRRAVRGGAKP
jgi:hypothetical protein